MYLSSLSLAFASHTTPERHVHSHLVDASEFVRLSLVVCLSYPRVGGFLSYKKTRRRPLLNESCRPRPTFLFEHEHGTAFTWTHAAGETNTNRLKRTPHLRIRGSISLMQHETSLAVFLAQNNTLDNSLTCSSRVADVTIYVSQLPSTNNTTQCETCMEAVESKPALAGALKMMAGKANTKMTSILQRSPTFD